MGILEKLREKAKEATQQYFESEEVEEPIEQVAETSSELRIPEEIVEEDIQNTANEILQEAVAELDRTGDTIYAVRDCIETMGQDSEPAMITKMITKVAKKNPEVLKQDGENRLSRIQKVVNDVKVSSQKALEEATNREMQIREAENASETSYTFDVSTLKKQCEDDIMQLRLKLQSDIEAREKKRDMELESLRKEKEEGKAERAKIEALNRAVIGTATKKQEEIKLYLSKLQVEA